MSNISLNVDNNSDEYKYTGLDNSDFGYTLMLEQKKVLYAMIHMENNKIRKVNNCYDLEYNVMRLNVPYGFGKSIISLALVKSKNDPISRNFYSHFSNDKLVKMNVRRNINIDTTLIIISPLTINQWEEYVIKCNLNTLFVDTMEDLDILIINMFNHTLHKFDLIIMVYRKLRHDYTLPFDERYLERAHSNFSLISVLSIDKIWKRIIIDDYDLINISYDMSIPCKILWLLSSNNTEFYYKRVNNNSPLQISSVNHELINYFTDPNISELTISSKLIYDIPQVEIYNYIFENSSQSHLMYTDDILEQINLGKVIEAAVSMKLCIQCDNIHKFFFYLLCDSNNLYKYLRIYIII